MSWAHCIEAALLVVDRRAGRDTIQSLAARLEASRPDGPAGSVVTALELIPTLVDELRERTEDTANRQAALAAITDPVLRKELIRDQLLLSQARKDLQALSRWLDEDAIRDRQRRALHRLQQSLQFLLQTVTHLVETAPPERLQEELPPSLLRTIAQMTSRLVEDRQLPWTTRAAACGLLGVLVRRHPRQLADRRQILRSTALAVQDESWVQVAALEAYASFVDAEVCADVLRSLLVVDETQARQRPSDHCFVRARAAVLCGRIGRRDLLMHCLTGTEASEHVQISAVRTLASLGIEPDLEALIEQESSISERVRAAAVLAVLPDEQKPGCLGWAALVAKVLTSDRPSLHEILLHALLERRHFLADWVSWTTLRDTWREPLARLGGDPELSELSGHLTRWLTVHADPVLHTAAEQLGNTLEGVRPGHSQRLPESLSSLSSTALLDLLASAAIDNLDLSARRERGSWRVYRGTRSRPALWRLLHELRTPAPDKRQAHSHITDQIPEGELVAPALRMSEVTPTRVPGQRLSSPEGISWGAHLPTPAILLAASRRGRIEVATPTGRAVITCKGRLAGLKRLRSHLAYVRLARQREEIRRRHSDPNQATEAYDQLLAQQGYQVTRLRAALPPEVVALLLDLIRPDGNTLLDVGLLSGLMLTGWLARATWSSHQIRRRRRQIPLVVGGWGSRGKSGTERLKAALFHGLGFQVLSKTTGCEAMVLVGIPGAPMEEVGLYRPYDKASIWEQGNVLRLAAQQQVQVMLWECMALKDRYVDIMQRHWMQDDYATITNTYPDHEDVQGPTGQDVTRVISRFLPDRAVALSTEQHMSPLLFSAAQAKKTHLSRCRPEEWQLLPEDLLARFPYRAHPRNLALVIALARELEIPADVALKEMADHVIPDLGVLKEYGPIPSGHQQISFVNGMSANERAGFVSNWDRMKLSSFGPRSGLRECLCVVVNNRADRLARQAAFVDIALLDFSADTLAIIGTNVDVFAREWRAGLQTVLRPRLLDLVRDGTSEQRVALLESLSKRLRRMPLSAAEVLEVLEADPEIDPTWLQDEVSRLWAAGPQWVPPTDPRSAVQQWLCEVSWLHRLQQDLDGWSPDEAVDTLCTLLAARLLPLSDSKLSGDQVNAAISGASPDRCSLRILGCCNIKGTGLDFVYRWVSVGRVLGWLAQLESARLQACQEAINGLGQHQDYGLLDVTHAHDRVAAMLQDGALAQSELETELRALHIRLGHKRDALTGGLEQKRQSVQVVQTAKRWAEPLGSIHRRQTVDQLMDDLGTARVGIRRAAAEMRLLNAKQKGK